MENNIMNITDAYSEIRSIRDFIMQGKHGILNVDHNITGIWLRYSLFYSESYYSLRIHGIYRKNKGPIAYDIKKKEMNSHDLKIWIYSCLFKYLMNNGEKLRTSKSLSLQKEKIELKGY